MLDIDDLSHLVVSNNIRHELDQANVARLLEAQLERIERRRVELKSLEQKSLDTYDRNSMPPPGPWYVDDAADRWIQKERDHFNQAHVVETPIGEKRFYLSYSASVDDSSNRVGPFDSLHAARLWFLLGGR